METRAIAVTVLAFVAYGLGLGLTNGPHMSIFSPQRPFTFRAGWNEAEQGRIGEDVGHIVDIATEQIDDLDGDLDVQEFDADRDAGEYSNEVDLVVNGRHWSEMSAEDRRATRESLR
jgi:hypothetical protein